MKKIVLILVVIVCFDSIAQLKFPPVHGAWLTNVDSDALKSKDNIYEAVNLCDSLGINTLFVVMWNKGMTLYPSKIMKKMFGEEIEPGLAGRDPLRELLDAAHKKNIKVIPWFEFGFSSSYMLNGGRLIKTNPSWAAIDTSGKLVQKNGFEWMNGLNPEVQDFMLSLILEVVKNYNVDGIQGDDRLPAMPVEAGYDKYTVELYQKEHSGAKPPLNFRDEKWMQWRADKLTVYMKKIYESVKSINKNCIVSMSPSPFPWGRDEYLQDWPAWLNQGIVDMICPQLYRYEAKDYVKMLEEAVPSQISKENMDKFFPGILLKLGKYYATEDYLKTAVSENRKRGVTGEVYFFFEGLKKTPQFFIDTYKSK